MRDNRLERPAVGRRNQAESPRAADAFQLERPVVADFCAREVTHAKRRDIGIERDRRELDRVAARRPGAVERHVARNRRALRRTHDETLDVGAGDRDELRCEFSFGVWIGSVRPPRAHDVLAGRHVWKLEHAAGIEARAHRIGQR